MEDNNMNINVNSENNQKKSNKNVIIIAAIVVVIIAVVIILLCGGKKSETDKDTNSTNETTTTTTTAVVDKPTTGTETNKQEKIVCEKVLSENEVIKTYHLVEIVAENGRVITAQNLSKVVYLDKADYENSKSIDKDNKLMVYNDGESSSINYSEEAINYTKDESGADYNLPVNDFKNSFVEQEYTCK